MCYVSRCASRVHYDALLVDPKDITERAPPPSHKAAKKICVPNSSFKSSFKGPGFKPEQWTGLQAGGAYKKSPRPHMSQYGQKKHKGSAWGGGLRKNFRARW
mmetsp:Transcript_61035/g.138046  ORF Transcript_61035/g.138046 Transcript_61035/m.138046 type:complete len:102 (-) Transcript_61035:97-402(-)